MKSRKVGKNLKRSLSHMKRSKGSAKNLRVYSNLSQSGRRKAKLDSRSRQRAEYLATLPKSRWRRFTYRMNPRRLAKYWFSKEGGIMMLKIAGIGLAVLAILVIAIFAYFRKDLAVTPDELAAKVHSSATTFYDRTGKTVLWRAYKNENRIVIPNDQIPDYVKDSTIAIEDRDFYKHGGFDVTGIMRALVTDISHGKKSQGASTITQQLVRNAVLENYNKTYTRKIKEIILSIEVERLYTKDQILGFYLNEIPYGGTSYGIESAAQTYFGKHAKNLTLDEAATLAAMIQSPTYYSPTGPNKAELIDRRNIVLSKMQEQGYITQEQEKKAKKTDTLAKVAPRSATSQYSNIIAPHFVLEIEQELEQKYGASNVLSGGWKVITTLDTNMQKIAEKAVKENIKYVDMNGGNNAALVAVDPKTGQVLAEVGSRDFNYPGYGQTNAATALLQPGSSVKIFDYAELFKRGDYGPGSVLTDEPIDIAGYKPLNFDKQWRGNISIRQALGESRNIPAVKAANIAGVQNVIKLSHEMGDHLYCKNQDCGLSAAIGGGTLRLDQHVNAYATLARMGKYIPQSYVLKITDSSGNVVEQWKETDGKSVLDPQISWLLSDILADNNARIPTFGVNNYMVVPGVPKISVKTGTTDDSKDGWMMGYTPSLSAGVWVGKANGLPMYSFTDTQTGPIFQQFMSQAHQYLEKEGKWTPTEWFERPKEIKRLKLGAYTDWFQSWFKTPTYVSKEVTVDKVSKMLATSCTPDGARVKVTATGTSDPHHPKDITYYATGYDLTKKDNVHKCSDSKPNITLSTSDGNQSNILTLQARVTKGTFPLSQLDFIVDGQKVSSKSISGNGTYTYNFTFSKPGQHTLQATVTDKGYYTRTSSTTANVVVSPQHGGSSGGQGQIGNND